MPFFPRSRKDGRTRRREDDGVHAVAFEVESIEFVQASDDVGLLRVAGSWTAPASRALNDIVLAVDRGTEIVELTPLPDLNGVAPLASPAGEAWRGAFTMAIELVDDPRAELALVADDDVRVELPRAGEWAALQEQEAAEAAVEAEEAEPESPVVADLVAKLDEVARLEDEPAPATELVGDPEVESLRADLELLRVQLEEARAELELERRRREAVDEEMRARMSVEDDLRNAMAMQEAELAAAAAQASQRARQAERRRDLVPPSGTAADHPESPRAQPASEDFLTRLETARRLSEAAG